MPAYIVTMDVDGEVIVETINGCKDGLEAIKKAKDKHQTLVLSVSPLEVQMGLDDVKPEDHPGQTDLTRDLDDRPDLAMEMAPPMPDVDDDEFDGDPFPETTTDGPFEDAAANPFGESVPDPAHAEAVLAQMRGIDGSDEDGFDS